MPRQEPKSGLLERWPSEGKQEEHGKRDETCKDRIGLLDMIPEFRHTRRHNSPASKSAVRSGIVALNAERKKAALTEKL